MFCSWDELQGISDLTVSLIISCYDRENLYHFSCISISTVSGKSKGKERLCLNLHILIYFIETYHHVYCRLVACSTGVSQKFCNISVSTFFAVCIPHDQSNYDHKKYLLWFYCYSWSTEMLCIAPLFMCGWTCNMV